MADEKLIDDDEEEVVVVSENEDDDDDAPLAVDTKPEIADKAEEEVKEEPAPATAEGDTPTDEELDGYSARVQARIKKLVADRRRDAQDKEEALRVSQLLLEENRKLKGQMTNLDAGYVHEYGARLDAQEHDARALFQKAYDDGDSAAMAEQQSRLARLAVERDRHTRAKNKLDQQRSRPQQEPPQQQLQQPQPQQQRQTDPRAEKWAADRPWFGTDKAMTLVAMSTHGELVEEGFDPTSDEYYDTLNKRLRDTFPHKFVGTPQKGQQMQAQAVNTGVAPANASASRRPTAPSGRTVKLNARQIRMAESLGITKEQYAAEVMKLEQGAS